MSLLSLSTFTVSTGLSSEQGAILLRCRKMTPDEAVSSGRLVALSIAVVKYSGKALSPARAAVAQRVGDVLPEVEITPDELKAAHEKSVEMACALVKAVSVDGGQSWTSVRLVPAYTEVDGELWAGAFHPDLYAEVVLQGWGEYFAALVSVARFRSEAAAAAGGGGEPVRDAPERADEAAVG